MRLGRRSAGPTKFCKRARIAADTAASTENEPALQRLSWRAVAVGQNFSNRRRKIINAGTGHDDAVTASMSFLSYAQEFPAVVLSEFHVEMLALDLQFSRLDNVIHFYLRPPTLPQSIWAMEAKSTGFFHYFPKRNRPFFIGSILSLALIIGFSYPCSCPAGK